MEALAALSLAGKTRYSLFSLRRNSSRNSCELRKSSIRCTAKEDPEDIPRHCCPVAQHRDELRDIGTLELVLRYANYFRNPKLAGGDWWNEVPDQVIYTDGYEPLSL